MIGRLTAPKKLDFVWKKAWMQEFQESMRPLPPTCVEHQLLASLLEIV